MATNSIIEQLKDESSESKMVGLMKELLAATTEEQKNALKTKLDTLGKDPTASCKINRDIEKFTFRQPNTSLDTWLAKVRQKEMYPVHGIHYKVEHSVPWANTKESSWLRNEDHAAHMAKVEAWADTDKEPTEEQVRKLEMTIRARTLEWNLSAKTEKQEWVQLIRTTLGDTRAEDTCLRFIQRPGRNDEGKVDWFKTMKVLAKTGLELGYVDKHYKATLDRWVSFFPQI
jgi:hypothetical protein